MASEGAKKVLKEVRPILSLDRYEAKRRVISLYKAWYRQIPYIVKQYDLQYDEAKCKQRLKEEFTKHCQIKDIRIVDMLVIRGQMDLKEIVEKWISKRGVARYFDANLSPKPSDFLGKFLTQKH